ncbi:(4Fe-4S)-binding protein [candidate division WOR-1 bacterium RIFOXYB2_FULL_42_35]|uniref:(4Fe-4S)-binding protein n=1 Tax=candidate division WOR-1 bacterium RIFOXYC2_FULL_41_25 TaxID=1802586 RepID=A0A1F4TLQ8_UNCSA|nr:MAG: (4Fe-4S)-binding protein [candidate division WOR-1 bacterium RIFOXYB2_FULL_42_35]OGC23073.1 MAG: (4Fe-4S)-binding protein [candidate division WOR-1 bacterium RIFOXYA2_FULL_41_14]OGC33645.1 MAG: (4Fe-4S)-binding protein [candidate division WOR-1 bacterium RIFOXYC2_FULL_41_25]OGC43608.1 MAG: (4Fe-4S)-binding protein [candidate division WOR-1 bacterium RIFOXYD2_FULL_41_8]
MIISVASGKGGTGKTTIATSLAFAIGNNVQLLDCDVEEPNAHIFINPQNVKTEQVFVLVPRVDETLCNYCGKCSGVCEFNAIAVANKKVLIFDNLCHACGGCKLLCPQKAITEIRRVVGKIETGERQGVELISGVLNVSEAMAIPVISAVKNKINRQKTVIIDASPGTSCPMVAAVKGSDFCLLVTESTPFGLHDLSLAYEVTKKMGIPTGLVINKYDSSFTQLEDYCQKEKLAILLKIPEDRQIAEAYSKGLNLVEVFPEHKEKFLEVMKLIESRIKS